jgi:hypothetical protein
MTLNFRKMHIRKYFTIPLLLVLIACVSQNRNILGNDQSQVALRQIQSRSFDTTDTHKTLRTVIATMQDLSFVIDKADNDLGTVSGTKLDGYALRMTVSVRPKGEKQLIVRANAQYNTSVVEDPEPYQQFFAALERAMFLTANSVD